MSFAHIIRGLFVAAQCFPPKLTSNWIGLILLKLKIYYWNYCSKIIFKCINSTVGPIFNEKIAKKWNLLVHNQYIMYCLWQKSKHLRLLFIKQYMNSNHILGFSQNAWKKKKKSKTHTWEENVYPNIHLIFSVVL